MFFLWLSYLYREVLKSHRKKDERNIYAIMKTMSPPGYRHNGFVETHALYHIMYGYTLLVPMKQRVLNTLSKKHNINGHRWSTTFDIYKTSLTHLLLLLLLLLLLYFFLFFVIIVHFIILLFTLLLLLLFLNIYHCFVIMFIKLRSLIYYLISWFLTYF